MVGRTAARLGLAFEREVYASPSRRLPRGPEQARLYLLRWKRWLRRFRGVATKYLDHYLVWFRLLDRLAGRPAHGLQWEGYCLLGRFP